MENQNLIPSEAALRRKLPKYLIILPILVTLIISLIFVNYKLGQMEKEKALNQQAITPVASIPTVPVAGKLSNLEIAKKVLDCLDHIRDEKGVYAMAEECSSPTECQITAVDHRAGLSVLWGRTKYIEKTNDPEELTILIKDIDLYLDSDKIPVVAPDFWSRKFFYEMRQSKIFSSEDKKKIQDLASKARPGESVALGQALKEMKKPDYKEPDLVKLMKIEKLGKEGAVKKIDEYDFQTTTSFAGDFLYWYLWQEDPEQLKLAKQFFSQALETYFSAKEISLSSSSLLGLTALDFYQITKEKPFLDFALTLFKEPETTMADPFTLSLTAMFSDGLYKITGEKGYDSVKEKIIEALISKNFDFTGFGGDFAGDGCFYDIQSAQKNRGVKVNGLISGLLSQ